MRTKATYSMVYMVGTELHMEEGLSAERLAEALGETAGSNPVHVFKGDSIPFTIDTAPRITLGTPKTRKPRAKAVDPGSVTPKRKYTRKAVVPPVVTPVNGKAVEA